jgi:hypothetical protein
MDQEKLESVGQGTIHVCSRSPKFGEWYQAFRSQTPKIWWSQYQSYIRICQGPVGLLSIGEFQTPLYSNLWSISHYVAFLSFICPLSFRLGTILLHMNSGAVFRCWNGPKSPAITPTAHFSTPTRIWSSSGHSLSSYHSTGGLMIYEGIWSPITQHSASILVQTGKLCFALVTEWH